LALGHFFTYQLLFILKILEYGISNNLKKIRLAVSEIEGRVFLNEMVIIGEVAMNDGVGIGAMLDARNEVLQDAGFEGGRPLGEASGFIQVEPGLRGNEIPEPIDSEYSAFLCCLVCLIWD